jgi:hypothetical protein
MEGINGERSGRLEKEKLVMGAGGGRGSLSL